jgi:hypothetical protein
VRAGRALDNTDRTCGRGTRSDKGPEVNFDRRSTRPIPARGMIGQRISVRHNFEGYPSSYLAQRPFSSRVFQPTWSGWRWVHIT